MNRTASSATTPVPGVEGPVASPPGAPLAGAERDPSATWALAQALIHGRHHVSPRRLAAPGPDMATLLDLLALAAAAPDHGRLSPWRFILVPEGERARLGEAFAMALLDRDPGATPEQLDAARQKAARAPVLLIAIARLGAAEPDVPAAERLVSLGAALQNLLLGAHALGYGAGLTSGQAMRSPRLAALCDLGAGEQAVCCISIGTVSSFKARSWSRPQPQHLLSVLGAPPAPVD